VQQRDLDVMRLYYIFTAEFLLKECFNKIMGKVDCFKRPVRRGTVLLKNEVA